MVSWKQSKLVGMVAAAVFVLAVCATIITMAQRQATQRQILQHRHPPAIHVPAENLSKE